MTVRNHQSPPIEWRGSKISPIGQAVQFNPSARFGFVWNRPVAVRIQPADGASYVQPVYDLTRIIQILIVCASLAVMYLLNWMTKRR
ncbi:MAG: hypothetical protein AB1453_06905 [Chloroflexota bacterium]|jgi:hypothetical protein